MPKKIFIKTLGCQMNEYDSNRIYDLVKGLNYFPTNIKNLFRIVLNKNIFFNIVVSNNYYEKNIITFIINYYWMF